MEEKTMQVVMFEPGKDPYVKRISNTLRGWQYNVGDIGSESYVQIIDWVVRVGKKKMSIKVFMDEEGKFKGYMPNICIRTEEGILTDYIVGTCFATVSRGLGFPKKLKSDEIRMIVEGLERFTI